MEMKKERTLVFIKYPQSTNVGDILGIITLLNKNGFGIFQSKTIQLNLEQARNFYREHQEKPFFDELSQAITKGPIIPIIVEKTSSDIIKEIRDLVGDKDPKKAAPGTIRNSFGIWLGENAIHASDCIEARKRECQIVFPEYNNLFSLNK